MPKLLNLEEKKNLIPNLRLYAKSLTGTEQPKHEYIRLELKAFALGNESDETEKAKELLNRVPSAATIRDWLKRDQISSVQPRFEETLYSFLEANFAEARIMEITEYSEIRRLYRFFGYQPHLIEKVGPQIDGLWNMYRRWSKPLDRYLLSPVRIVYDAKANVIVAYDNVQINLSGAYHSHAPEQWVGVVVPQGRYVYLIFRVMDHEDGDVKNLKFVVLDDLELSAEVVDGRFAFHYMSGQTMIGINSHAGSNSFVTVFERIPQESDIENNPIMFDELPIPIKDLLTKKENVRELY